MRAACQAAATEAAVADLRHPVLVAAAADPDAKVQAILLDTCCALFNVAPLEPLEVTGDHAVLGMQ